MKRSQVWGNEVLECLTYVADEVSHYVILFRLAPLANEILQNS